MSKKVKNDKSLFKVLAGFLVVTVAGTLAVSWLDSDGKIELPAKSLSVKSTLNETLENAEGNCKVVFSKDLKLTLEKEKTVLGSKDMETITIDGNSKGSITAEGAKQSIISPAEGKLVFKNLTINDNSERVTNDRLDSLYFGGEVIFENCTFTNSIYLTADVNAKFVDCTFQSVSEKVYSVWMEDGSADFENCLFEGYRGLKIHEQNDSDVQTVNINSCTFKNIVNKPGIAIGTVDINTSVSIKNSTFDGCYAFDAVGCLSGKDGIYESDTLVSEFTFVEKNNIVKNTVFPEDENKIVYSAALGNLNDVVRAYSVDDVSTVTHVFVNNSENLNITQVALKYSGLEDFCLEIVTPDGLPISEFKSIKIIFETISNFDSSGTEIACDYGNLTLEPLYGCAHIVDLVPLAYLYESDFDYINLFYLSHAAWDGLEWVEYYIASIEFVLAQ